MSSSTNKQMPDKDPYKVLGLSFDASEAEITKAYRRLALKLHPDKQQNVSEKQREKMAHEFHDIQQARAFLLDAEFESARTKYRTKLASQRLRRAADEARDKAMSVNRKRMREELKEQEAQANKSTGDRRTKRKEADIIEQLRQDGNKMRQVYANKAAAEELEKELKRKESKDERQVRLKWSRKKISISPSEDSLAKILERFGSVDHVEMLGSKGNSALVTFKDAGSVSPCVQFYKESDEMRASYVGKRKDREEQDEKAEQDHQPSESFKTTTSGRDGETVQDWKLRREAEREKLLRQMEAEERENTGMVRSSQSNRSTTPKRSSTTFPPKFPAEYDGLAPFEKLEKAEGLLLAGLVAKDVLDSLSSPS